MAHKKIINDPVFGFITIPNEFLLELLQHPYLQRLTRIRQMGLAYLVYPGATHTRFLHSIGAMHLMNEAITGLRLQGIEITHEEGIAAMAAILLHDVGHGPFSHVLENTLVEGITHEDISLMMMKEINRETNGKLQLAIDIFTDKYHKHFLHQLVSSQLDVDRLDYLCRDSFFCGVSEGTVASARILKMLTLVDGRLAIEAKGIYSIEKFLVARRLMYWQVYLHKTSVAAEQMLIKILSRAKLLAEQGKEMFCSPALKIFLYQKINKENFDFQVLEQYAVLDDSDILSAIKVWCNSDDVVLSKLCTAFTNRRLFKTQLLEQPLSQTEITNWQNKYAEKFNISLDEANYLFSLHTSSKDTYSAADDSIDIIYKDGTIKDIANASDMLNLSVLTKKVSKHYLFYFPID
ncbi:MAG: HD domain-containing protein [Paludibacteraceae bacterium]|nr:HD domain-containing protein [Paludibacteraceae bacterium]